MEYDPMPSGGLSGDSYSQKMSDEEFTQLCENVISFAMMDAIEPTKLVPVTDETANKVRRIVKASGFHYSETARHVRTAAKIAATSFVMFGEQPTLGAVRSIIDP